MNLLVPEGATKSRKRLGRGQGSGTGCTAGKGTKGQKARSGKKIRPGFEGGQMPLYRRLPHRGFSNYPFKQIAEEVSLTDLERKFNDGDTISIKALHDKKLVSANAKFVKVLNSGELKKKLTLSSDVYTSQGARKQILALGGTVASDKNENEEGNS